MNNVYKFLTIILVLLISSVAFGQIDRSISKVGTTAAPFLKMYPGARAVGMGGAFTAVSDDIYSAYYNPAGVALIEGFGEVSFNHSQWIADIAYNFASGSINLEGLGSLFFSLSSLRVDKEKVRTFDFPTGDGRYWDATALSIGLGFAKKLTDRFSIGMQAKYIQETIWNSKANGFAIDIGTYYITPFNDMVIGASVTNFGSKMQLDGRDIQVNIDPDKDPKSGPNNIPAKYKMEGYDLPLQFKVGLAMNVLESRYLTIKTALDAIHPNDNDEYLNFGAEMDYNQNFFLRGGLQRLLWDDDNGEKCFTFGAGIKYTLNSGLNIKVNYAYADFDRLKDVHYFDLSIGF